VNLTPELHQIRDLEEKIRRLIEEQARSKADPEFQNRLNVHLLALVEQRAREAERYNRLLQEHVHELQLRKERMATTVHDLKIPVTISLLNLELAESEDEPAVRTLYLTAVRRELAFLLDTIGNLLDLERDGRGQVGQLESVNLPRITQDLLDRLQILVRDKDGLKFANMLPPDMPLVRGDPHRLTRVLSNLLSNSIKYTETGTIEVGYIPPADGDPPGFVRIFVRDTGSGIDADRREKLFQLFSGDESRYDSTGVGLVFVQKTVAAYGGRVLVESKKGGGTRVILELPIDSRPKPAST
jgi:signal transduction histidine kinase